MTRIETWISNTLCALSICGSAETLERENFGRVCVCVCDFSVRIHFYLFGNELLWLRFANISFSLSLYLFSFHTRSYVLPYDSNEAVLRINSHTDVLWFLVAVIVICIIACTCGSSDKVSIMFTFMHMLSLSRFTCFVYIYIVLLLLYTTVSVIRTMPHHNWHNATVCQ